MAQLDGFFQTFDSFIKKNYISTQKKLRKILGNQPINITCIWLLSRAILMNQDYYRKDPFIRKWTYRHSWCYLWNNEIGNFWFWYLWFRRTTAWFIRFVQFQGNQFERWDQMLSACSDGILRSEHFRSSDFEPIFSVGISVQIKCKKIFYFRTRQNPNESVLILLCHKCLYK